MLPCRTPAFIGKLFESSPSQRTWKVQCKRKDFKVRYRGVGRKRIL